MKLPISMIILSIAISGPVLAKECRMPDPQPGVQIQMPPGCKALVQTGRTEAQRQDNLRANQGFIDLGNGTQVRISGRVRAEFDLRR